MNLLFVASECAPFVKTGGLADVIGAVPKALKGLGASVKVMLPAYPALLKLARGGSCVMHYDDLFGGSAQLMAVQAEGLELLLLDAPHLFERGGSIYLNEHGHDWHDNHFRFAALSRAGADVGLKGLGRWKPDIVHVHDWQAGLIPAYLAQGNAAAPKTVMTIHNIAFQGLFDGGLRYALGIEDRFFHYEAAEYWGNIGFLKAGIAMADKVTTVSPTYARELMTPEFGMGLEGLMQARARDVSGILNGIDCDVWDPATDPQLPRNYTSRSLKRRAENKAAIEARFGLSAQPDAPLFCVISRLTTQKGLDLLLEVLPRLVARGGRLALLGSGDAGMEAAFRQAATDAPDQVGVIIGYDEALSHLLQGGADGIIVPSRFEPCGLTQLYGVRYGTLPIVAKTGGLADTVINATPETLKAKQATGFSFAPITAERLADALGRACDLYADKDAWAAMQRTAMRYPVDWAQSAPAYMQLYQDLIADPQQIPIKGLS